MKRIIVLIFIVFFIGFIIINQIESQSGIYMSVSGRIIEKKSGKGISNVTILISNLNEYQDIETESDSGGYFYFSKVPPGTYMISSKWIHATCPIDLILEPSLKEITFDVIVSKKVENLIINLIKGGKISGKVFGPDGITPFTAGKVYVANGVIGKNPNKTIRIDGYYEASGLGFSYGETHDFVVKVMPDGVYADDIKIVKLSMGEEKGNFNFIIGVGKINVKGQVTNKTNGAMIPNAKITVLSIDRHVNKMADGVTYTNSAGDYSIIGFKNEVDVTITAYHDDFQYKEIYLKLHKGDNAVDFSLTPKEKK